MACLCGADGKVTSSLGRNAFIFGRWFLTFVPSQNRGPLRWMWAADWKQWVKIQPDGLRNHVSGQDSQTPSAPRPKNHRTQARQSVNFQKDTQ